METATLGTAREHRTVTRIVRIMEMVAAAVEPVRLTDLAQRLGAPKTSIHGLIRGLVATGYLRENMTGYLIGPAVGSLLGEAESPVGKMVRPALDGLRAIFDETVILSARVGSSVVYVEAAESSQLIRYAAPLRQRRPLYPTSTGKCFLAHMDPSRCRTLLEEFLTDATSVRAALDELDRARADGVAYNRGETVTDVSAAASLVEVPDSSPVAIAVVGPSTRIAQRFPKIAEAVRAAAAEATERLQGRSP